MLSNFRLWRGWLNWGQSLRCWGLFNDLWDFLLNRFHLNDVSDVLVHLFKSLSLLWQILDTAAVLLTIPHLSIITYLELLHSDLLCRPRFRTSSSSTDPLQILKEGFTYRLVLLFFDLLMDINFSLPHLLDVFFVVIFRQPG